MKHFGARSLSRLPGLNRFGSGDAPDPGPAAVLGGAGMDDVVNRFAKELADAIAAAVADNPQVEACRARAREAGYDMRVTLEAVVGFVNRNNGAAVTKITTPARLLPARKTFELTTNDRRFLRSLRIGADEAKETVDNG
jgi:alkanesulfonate monooxygenase SsuD/methylene tetrahydromethanopterin reductase-like flavin-dependent oxidoreductase (luciferase family)